MALVRCVTEMGMGVDVHGLDYTLAAKRAVFDAIHHSSLGFARLVGATAGEMIVNVTIGAPRPEKVNVDEVVDALRLDVHWSNRHGMKLRIIPVRSMYQSLSLVEVGMYICVDLNEAPLFSRDGLENGAAMRSFSARVYALIGPCAMGLITP